MHTISNIAINDAQRKIESTPTDPIQPPLATGSFEVNQTVIDGEQVEFQATFCTAVLQFSFEAFPVKGTTLVHAFNYGVSLWGKTAKVVVQLPTRKKQDYFLKVFRVHQGAQVL
jgi:hypothetical protein